MIDFVTVGVEFARSWKRRRNLRREWIDKMLKILPCYTETSLLPETVAMHQEEIATFVKEEDYARVALQWKR